MAVKPRPIKTHPSGVPATSPPRAHDLFDEVDYIAWCRAIARETSSAIARETLGEPAVDVLFESTMTEPTALLAARMAAAFAPNVTDRFHSVFGEGNPFLIAALAKRYGVEASRLLATTGASNGVGLILKTFTRPGDHVLAETPGFDLLNRLAVDAGCVVDALPRRAPDFAVDDIGAVLTPQTRLVILTNLHNPSGRLLGAPEISAIATTAAKVGARVVVDEVYLDFAGGEGTAAALLAPNCLSVSSLTKVYGLFALKCGWIVGGGDDIRALTDVASYADLGVSKLAHAAGALVMEDLAPFEQHWRAVIQRNRPIVAQRHIAMTADGLIDGPLPRFGCMWFPKIVGVADTRALAQWLWAERRILVAPGEFFGLAGHVRLGFGGAAAPLEAGLKRLHDALKDYRARA